MQQSGFQFGQDISKVVMPLSPDSLLGRAAASGRIEGVLAAMPGASTGMPFGGEPGCAVALPIAIGGAVVAVMYADDSDRIEFASTAPQALVKFAELLRIRSDGNQRMSYKSTLLYFNWLSQKLAAKAWDEGRFDKSVVPVIDDAGHVVLAKDEFPRPQTTAEGLAALKPSFTAIADITNGTSK